MSQWDTFGELPTLNKFSRLSVVSVGLLESFARDTVNSLTLYHCCHKSAAAMSGLRVWKEIPKVALNYSYYLRKLNTFNATQPSHLYSSLKANLKISLEPDTKGKPCFMCRCFLVSFRPMFFLSVCGPINQ